MTIQVIYLANGDKMYKCNLRMYASLEFAERAEREFEDNLATAKYLRAHAENREVEATYGENYRG